VVAAGTTTSMTSSVKNYNSHSAVQAGQGCCTAERDEADEPAESWCEGEDRIGAQESSDIM